jgi:hypothetical protein
VRVKVVEVDDSGPIQRATVVLPTPPIWEVDAEGIKDLLPPPPPRQGRKPVQNWQDIVDQEIVSLQYKGSPLLEDLEQLYVHIAAQVEHVTGTPPKDMKRFRRRIRDLLGVHN